MKQRRVEMEYIPIEEITPYENNPRINAEAVPMLAKSINDFGFLVPIVLDKDNVIAAGHTRYLASLELGLTEVPVIKASDLTPKQIKAFRLADNKVAELAGWDFDLLDVEMADLADDFDMEDYGFILDDYDESFDEDEDDGEDIIVEQDRVVRERPEIHEETGIDLMPGDIVHLGLHTLYCGDITDDKGLGHLLGGKVPALAFSEPSRASLGTIGNTIDLLLSYGVVNVAVVYPLTDGNKSAFARLLGERANVLKTIVYRSRPQELKSPGRLMPVIDPIPIFSKEDQTDVFSHDPGSWTGLVNCKDPWTHYLASVVIEALTDENDLVLDMDGDMGHTLLACEDLGRPCVVVESDMGRCANILAAYLDRTGSKESISVERNGELLSLGLS